MDVLTFVEDYKTRLIDLIKNVDGKVIEQIIDVFEDSSRKKSRIYSIGNGGSSATASHWVNDFAIGIKRRGLAVYDMVSLCDNSAVTNAIANDIGFENIFYEQLRGILKPDDILIAISCSGNSPNIVKAVKYAKELGTTVIGCSGFDGGYLKDTADIVFHVDTPKGEYGLVEDVHTILGHVIYSYYIHKGHK